MIQNNRLWLLLSRRLSGEASPEELEELQAILEQSPDKAYLFDILHSYFTVPFAGTMDPEVTDSDFERRFRRILDEDPGNRQDPAIPTSPASFDPMQPPGRVVPIRRVIYAAAPLVGVLLLSWGVFRSSSRSVVPAGPVLARGGEVLARSGARTKLVLPDGTQVWLNSNSRLKYSDDFNTRSREVGLEGEAYFDVAKDPQRPFIVHAADLNVRVLGTAFTIKSYPQDETIEATLLKGAIEISRQDHPNTPRVILKPNEKLVFSKHLLAAIGTDHSTDTNEGRPGPSLPDISVNAIAGNVPDSEKVETAWLYNRLVFNGDSFKELAEKMERWYNVKILFEDEDLYRYRFGGAFANETVQDALNALQLTAKFTYKINGNEIQLYDK